MSYDRTSNLKRGAACLACRRRKTRCDGAQPVCNNCIEKNCVDDCEYSDGTGLTASQVYEENIRQLEARKRELEASSAASRSSGSLQLQQAHQFQGGVQGEVVLAQEPSMEIVKRLVDTFLPFASELGFFLHPQRFKASVARAAPAGDQCRPAPALLFAVYLWGIRLSGNADALIHERSFHARAVQEAAANLSSGHPNRIVHGIQADVLLAYYYIAQERFAEAGHYVTSAMTTALSANLHKVRSRHLQVGGEQSVLPGARDPVEEGERILAMWDVFVLDKMVAVATGQAPNFVMVNDRPDRRVDVPWPMDMGDYEEGRLSLNIRTDRTIDKFLNNERTSDGAHNSSMTMLAKAVLLWEKASNVAQESALGQSPSVAFEAKKTELLIESLNSDIPPMGQFMTLGAVEDVRKRILWVSIVHAASIKVNEVVLASNGSDTTSRGKAVMAAVGIMDVIICTTARGVGFLNPFIAYTWVDAARVIAGQITHLRGRRQVWDQPSDMEDSLVRRLEKGIEAMSTFSNLFPLIRSKIGEIQRMYESVRTA